MINVDMLETKWVADPHQLFKCIRDPMSQKACMCITSQKLVQNSHWFHCKGEIEQHLLKMLDLKRTNLRGLKVDDEEQCLAPKDSSYECLVNHEKERTINTSLMQNEI